MREKDYSLSEDAIEDLYVVTGELDIKEDFKPLIVLQPEDPKAMLALAKAIVVDTSLGKFAGEFIISKTAYELVKAQGFTLYIAEDPVFPTSTPIFPEPEEEAFEDARSIGNENIQNIHSRPRVNKRDLRRKGSDLL